MSDARLSLVTLGVGDLARAARFYEALGWSPTPQSNESVVFLQGQGIVLSLFPFESLAADAALPHDPLPRFRGVALAINLAGEAETDRLFALALANGATSVKTPRKVFWGGYSGYFADPDGHLWELAHNPFFAFDAAGRLDLLAQPKDPA